MSTLESAWNLFSSGAMAPERNALPTPRDPHAVLRDVFGHKSFRGQQADVVEHVVGGGDAVVLFPTGAGKSMCYQIPAICRPGVGIVISPLIALMRDQVEALKQAGVEAAALNSSLSADESADVRRKLRNGRAIIDAGSKALTSDTLGMVGFGLIEAYPDAVITGLSEEHGTVDLTNCATKPQIGDKLRIIPNHACVVSNLFDTVTLISGDQVVETVDVAARGRVD